MNIGTAIILAGGQSRRMGRAKAWLPMGPEYSVSYLLRNIGAEVTQRIVVKAAGQLLPPLPPGVSVIEDRWPSAGPLAGMASAAPIVADNPHATVLIGCDTLGITPQVTRYLGDCLGDEMTAVIPRDEHTTFPLTAVYHPSAFVEAQRLVAEGERRLQALVERLRVRWVPAEELRAVDPQLLSLRCSNTPDEFIALTRAMQVVVGDGKIGPTNGGIPFEPRT